MDFTREPHTHDAVEAESEYHGDVSLPQSPLHPSSSDSVKNPNASDLPVANTNLIQDGETFDPNSRTNAGPFLRKGSDELAEAHTESLTGIGTNAANRLFQMGLPRHTAESLLLNTDITRNGASSQSTMRRLSAEIARLVSTLEAQGIDVHIHEGLLGLAKFNGLIQSDIPEPFVREKDHLLDDLHSTHKAARIGGQRLNKNASTLSKSWYPLPPMIHGGLNSDSEGFWLRGVSQATGETVFTYGCRLAEVVGTLRHELESLRIFYGNCELRQPNESCQLGELAYYVADQIQGRVSWIGGYWVHPDHRGQGLSALIPRLSRFVAYARWEFDCEAGAMDRKLADKGTAGAYGFTRVYSRFKWLGGCRGDLHDSRLLIMERDEVLNSFD